MNSVHQKSPFIFFSIILLVLLGAITYFYFYKYTPTTTIFWEEASIKVTTDWGACPPTFPCYETFLVRSFDGNVFHNEANDGHMSSGEVKSFVNKTYSLYQNNICTPVHETSVSQKYELNIDGKIYTFGGKQGCKEMQELMDAFTESINI